MDAVLVGSVTVGQLIAWIILGLLVGAMVGRLLRRRGGFGVIGNLVVGLVGAVIGGLLFDALGIDIGKNVELSLNDFIAAFVGALIFVGLVSLIRR